MASRVEGIFTGFNPSFDAARRRHLKAASSVLLTTLAAAFISGRQAAVIWQALSDTPLKPAGPRQGAESKIIPGFIESKITAPFMQLDKGHFHFLHEGVFNNDLVTAVYKDVMEDLMALRDAGHKMKGAGEMLGFTFNRAYRKLNRETRVNLPEESVHTGLFALATVLSENWLEPEDLKQGGVPDKEGADVDQFFWGENGVGQKVFPDFFGSPTKFRHVVHHMFVAFEWLYMQKYGLKDAGTLPNALQWWMARELPGQRYKGADGALLLSNIAGKIYEVVSTPEAIREWFIHPDRQPTEGLLDPGLLRDLRANSYGAGLGIYLAESVNNPAQSLASLDNVLKSAVFSHPKDP